MIADFENVFSGDETKTGMSGLQIVDCLSHIAFGSEYQGTEAVIVVIYLKGRGFLSVEVGVGHNPDANRLHPANFNQSFEDFIVF